MLGTTFSSGHHSIEMILHFDLKLIKLGLLFGSQQLADVGLCLPAHVFDFFSILGEDFVQLLPIALEGGIHGRSLIGGQMKVVEEAVSIITGIPSVHHRVKVPHADNTDRGSEA